MALLLACQSDPATCVDADGDGFGEGCKEGADCDDADAERHAGCGPSEADCDAEPEAEGCPCVGFRRTCRLGPEDTDGVGLCQPGLRFCRGGTWTRCEGAVGPGFERCNGLDDDCDGRADERVTSPCGGCDDACQGGVWGESDAPFVGEAPLALSGGGALTLGRMPRQAPHVWVANTEGMSVSRIDAVRAAEVARYALRHHPTHLAVDLQGDAWVAGPSAEGDDHGLYHIAADADRCLPRGTELVTSRGPGDVLPVDTDDCIVLRTALPEPVQALAVDGTRDVDGVPAGFPWLGYQDYLEQRDGTTGRVVRTVQTPALTPYSATFDPWGQLWLVDRSGFLARVDPASEPAGYALLEPPLACYELDSVQSDAAGRLLLSGFACENVLRFDPFEDRYDEVTTPGVLTTRGLALLGDGAWVVHTSGQLSRLGLSPLAFETTHGLGRMGFAPIDTHAVAADGEGQLWTISRTGGPEAQGVATRFDPEARRVTAQVPVGRGPRALGDFTGLSFGDRFETAGSERHTFIGCAVEAEAGGEPIPVTTRWQRLHIAYDAGAGARVTLRARHAAQLEALDDAAEGPWDVSFTLPAQTPPFELPFDEGGAVEVEVRLEADHAIGAPRVYRIGLEWRCPAPS